MPYYTSFKDYANKMRRLAMKGGGIERAVMAAHREIGRRWMSRSATIMRRRIYSKYIPTREEYYGSKGRKQVSRRSVLRARTAANRGAAPSGEKAWIRTGELLEKQRFKAFLGGVRLENYARKTYGKTSKGKPYAGARHNLGTPFSFRKNSVWTEVAEFQRKSLEDMRPFIPGIYQRRIRDAWSVK